ncbi:hypothetical protein HOK51_03685 [Candidatus Woesearchaeota archaeon]|jgi:hypothetical protein|nr:hypothetical protein [Candidatus Woesearchaeota archaeon]MBT6518923.1 hypothetical protein [Candidatus Woesearchaeota archaeon]MBT7367591.1 hypothetical protein [Candidatus Woesearchaeota archaeon]
MANREVNLETKIEKNLFKQLGNKFKTKLNNTKKYATLALTGIAVVAGGTYVGGCDHETTECCAQLDCESRGTGFDEYSCITTTNTIYKDELCVTLDDGSRDCCRCMYEDKTPDPNLDNF